MSANIDLRVTADTQGAQATATALDRVTASTKKLADESERYQQALKRMADAQADATMEAEMLAKSAQRRAALVAKEAAAAAEATAQQAAAEADLAEEAGYTAGAQQDLANAVKQVTKEDLRNIETTKQKTSWMNHAKDAAKGLAVQFPALGMAARLALNPIAVAVAAIAVAFKIFKTRVDEATRALASVELPDITERTAEDVNSNAKAWGELADALERTATAYNSVSESADRYEKNLKAQASQEKRLLESQKQLALARLESQKGSMSDSDYAQARAGIEEHYAGAALRMDERQSYAERLARVNREVALGTSAAQKQREADAIKVASAEQDAETESKLKAQAEAAQKGIAKAREWQQRIAEMQSGTGAAALGALPFYMRYGPMTGSDAYALEGDNINRLQLTVDRYRARQSQGQQREALRTQRAGLYGEATSEATQAFRIAMSAGGEDAAAMREMGVNRAIAGNASAARGYGTLGALASAAEAGKAKEEQLTQQIHQTITQQGGLVDAMIQALAQQQAFNQRVEQELRRKGAQLKGTL